VVLLALASFWFWYTALLFLIGIVLVMMVLVKRERLPIQYDDRLSDEIMDKARQWLVEKFGGGDRQD
jgi:hypothetical protein